MVRQQQQSASSSSSAYSNPSTAHLLPRELRDPYRQTQGNGGRRHVLAHDHKHHGRPQAGHHGRYHDRRPHRPGLSIFTKRYNELLRTVDDTDAQAVVMPLYTAAKHSLTKAGHQHAHQSRRQRRYSGVNRSRRQNRPRSDFEQGLDLIKDFIDRAVLYRAAAYHIAARRERHDRRPEDEYHDDYEYDFEEVEVQTAVEEKKSRKKRP